VSEAARFAPDFVEQALESFEGEAARRFGDGAVEAASPAPQGAMRGFSLAINVDKPEEVDEVIEAARAAGARITKEPVDAEEFDGRSAYFADPEDNYWEVACLINQTSAVAAALRRAQGLE